MHPWPAASSLRGRGVSIPEEALMQFDWSMVQRRIPGRIAWFVKDCGETHLSGEFTV